MPVGLLAGSNSWFVYGRRIVLNPDAAIWSSISPRPRDHRPCGAKLLVSSPNQLTPVMRTSLPLASTIWPPLVRNGDTADILGGACCDCAKAGGAAAPTVRPTVAMSMSSFIRRLFVSAAGHIMVIWVRISPGFRERLKVLKRFERCPSALFSFLA